MTLTIDDRMAEVRRIIDAGDPYTECLNGLWGLLESSTEFTRLVPESNRIKFTGSNLKPIPEEISGSMVPEVRLIQTGMTPHTRGASNLNQCVCRFELQISSGDQRLSALHNPLKWIAWKALLKAAETLVRTVVWDGEQIVRFAKMVSVTEGVSREDLNRGIIGWSSVWGIECELWFSKQP